MLALLRELFGPGADRTHVETRPWKVQLPSRSIEIELTTVSSNHHVELNPSDAGNNDRYVVQELIRDMAATRPVAAFAVEQDEDGAGAGGGAASAPSSAPPVHRSFKVLLLDEVDRLSRDAQHALRRTMERYAGACRLMLRCESLSRVIEPLRSRCLCVRVPAPDEAAIEARLGAVAALEGIAAPPALLRRVATQCGRNLRRALLALETLRATNATLLPSTPVPPVDWEAYVAEIARDARLEQSPRCLYLARGKMYELLVNCVPPELVLRRLALELLARLDDELRQPLAANAAKYEHRMQLGSKPIFHLEAFLARFLSDYKNYLVAAAA